MTIFVYLKFKKSWERKPIKFLDKIHGLKWNDQGRFSLENILVFQISFGSETVGFIHFWLWL